MGQNLVHYGGGSGSGKHRTTLLTKLHSTRQQEPTETSRNRLLLLGFLQKWNQQMLIIHVGAGECGKSTFFKQIKLLHGDGFTPEECYGFVDIIHDNMILAMLLLIRAVRTYDIVLNPQNKVTRVKRCFSYSSKRQLRIVYTILFIIQKRD